MRKVSIFVIIAAIATPAIGQQRRLGGSYPPELPGAKVEVYKEVGGAKLNMYIFSPEGRKPTDKGHCLLLRRWLAKRFAEAVPETLRIPGVARYGRYGGRLPG